ncbi:hypothetical protein [Methylobacterium sp. NEAU K]|uniref:hypothetical protein n=1 Tax=Methylobacterium sp. NEAU K TaxID=3064946 RepID=UPI002735C472|nr:hypothetical protein [Methylobacterium sp. NEAU K]MDP4005087.1 hypothetical protein [Methylobacterium sp. NEAU K]
MVQRIPGRDLPAPAMTCHDVERWLVAAFMAFTSSGIFSVRPNRLQPNDPEEMRATFDWVVFSGEVLGRGSEERIALLTWARATARRRIKRHRRLRLLRDVPGGTVTDYCNEVGIWRRTFDRRRKRACERLANAWNERNSR